LEGTNKNGGEEKFDEPFRSRDKTYWVIFLGMAFVLCWSTIITACICSTAKAQSKLSGISTLLPILSLGWFPCVNTDTEKTILIVDNEQKETAALRKQLEFAGFKTQVAHTGTGAIMKIEERPPNLV